MKEGNPSAKSCTGFVSHIFVCAIFLVSASALAKNNDERATTLSVSGSGASLSITACHEGACQTVTPPERMLNAVGQGYSDISLEDLTQDGVSEIVLTHGAEGNVNTCSKVYRFDSELKELLPLSGLKNPLCNHSIQGDHLISSYRSGAIWYEDIYKIGKKDISLIHSDSCIGCDYVRRAIYLDGAKTDTLLVANNLDYRLRTPILTTVVSPKATLYSKPAIENATKMYLIRGDEVALMDDASDPSNFWYKVRYATKKGTLVNAWIKCEDLKFCE